MKKIIFTAIIGFFSCVGAESYTLYPDANEVMMNRGKGSNFFEPFCYVDAGYDEEAKSGADIACINGATFLKARSPEQINFIPLYDKDDTSRVAPCTCKKGMLPEDLNETDKKK